QVRGRRADGRPGRRPGGRAALPGRPRPGPGARARPDADRARAGGPRRTALGARPGTDGPGRPGRLRLLRRRRGPPPRRRAGPRRRRGGRTDRAPLRLAAAPAAPRAGLHPGQLRDLHHPGGDRRLDGSPRPGAHDPPDGSGLMDLYGELILDHAKPPRHAALRAPYDVEVNHANPPCGDERSLRVHVVGEGPGAVLQDLSYDALGCSISVASTSVLAEETIGRP